ncbi:CoH1 [Coprinopsis cinerea okayama7|uniref:Hydrophobin n=1 Tax=Coprinopsis cinerea (strain Okayama-7 / 130 / ATCC MYA-4618 / FGSC 9003) TaxID=240176 RepID=A8NKF9_COPC7|nr:CoH1 [Coprinopsis cinerea okayama7\|eukprot:XP_001834438.2 CoH1 [Coprinopsis cinerea okayama7\
MQFKALVALTLATVAIAAPSNLEARQGQCNTGPVQCCNSVQRADSEAASKLLGLLGIVVQDVSIPIGITCTPITVIGLPGNSCVPPLTLLRGSSTQPVCCKDNSYKGVVAIGCTPININV